jgi:hypothetical protein
MPSMQSRLASLMTKHILGRQFKHSRSIPRWRNTMGQLARYQRMPAGTETQPVMVNGVAAEWVHAPDAKANVCLVRTRSTPVARGDRPVRGGTD